MKPAALAAITAILGVAIIAYLWHEPDNSAQNEVPIGGPFELTSEDGSRVTQENFAGRYMLLYFGYTYCPDICPTGLATMTTAYDNLPEDVRNKIVPVFITVDPDRDTVEVVRDYTELFHPDLIGLTGSQEDLEKTKTTFRVYAKKASDDPEDYLVDHSSFTYLIGPDAKYTTHFSHADNADTITAGLIEKTQ